MVQGLPAVDWKKPENNAKLFAAVISLIPGTPDYKKIAAVFGPNVPASAISYRLNVVRKEGAALGFTPGSGSGSPSADTKANGTTTTSKRAAPATKKGALKGKGRKRGMMPSDDSSDGPDMDTAMDSDEEESAANDKKLTTPARSAKRQKTIGRRAIKRVSPRQDKSKKTDYKNLDDPFVTMDSAKDEDGNNIFGEPSGTGSEDTYATDGSYKDPGEVSVKMEEAV